MYFLNQWILRVQLILSGLCEILDIKMRPCELPEVMEMFFVMTWVLVTRVYTFVKRTVLYA